MLLQIDNVSLTLTAQQRLLFHPFKTTVNEGEFIMLLGESGQGKTSLLRLLARLDIPSSGDIQSRIVKIAELSGQAPLETEITAWRRQFTYVAQQAVMLNGTIEDNLVLPFRLHKETYDQAKALYYMDRAGLSHLPLTQEASQCSGGEQQRIVEQMLQTWLDEGNHAIVWISHNRKQVHS